MSALYGTYARSDLAFERGEGARLFTADGTAYLDFNSGIGVNALGHGDPHVVAALKLAADKVWHTSNIFTIPEQERLGQRLVDATFADSVFFTNSGAEAVECAIKTARHHFFSLGQPDRYDVIAFTGSFHGRTLGTIAAGGNPHYIEGFGPPLPGFKHLAPGDLAAVEALIDDKTCGILIEPVQGEGGVTAMTVEFMQGLRSLCDKHGILLILDEVQCGYGRTGKFFAYEWAGIEPDIMAVAKGIGGGFPLGACLAKGDVAKSMVPGTHGSTYGGNPLACSVGNAVLDRVLGPGFLANAELMGQKLAWHLQQLQQRFPNYVVEVRGKGLIAGIRIVPPVRDFVNRLRRDHQLLAVAAGENVLRLLPPLIITEADIEEAIAKIADAFTALDTEAASTPAIDEPPPSAEGGRPNTDPAQMTSPRHFLSLQDFTAAQLRGILKLAAELKGLLQDGDKPPLLDGKMLAMIFERQSTRTRVSFDVGMRQLGGETMFLSGNDMQLAREETLADTARVMSRYVDAIMIRILDHDDLMELANASSIPVINGLTRRGHPCQVMADIMTFEEHRGSIAGKKVAWVGDSNNVMTSWVHATRLFGNTLTIGVPDEFGPDQAMLADIRRAGAGVRVIEDPNEAVEGADLVIADTWVSMGDTDATERRKVLKPYQVNPTLMGRAKANALFMHCLPAHRGDEVTDEVIDGPQSVVFDEAENRLHIQKAILCWCFGIERL